MINVLSKLFDWSHCIVCGIELDAYERQYADRLDCGHNICSNCLIEGAAIDHKYECAHAAPAQTDSDTEVTP